MQIISGDAHNIVLTAAGRVFTFGDNRKGQCGQGHFENCLVARPVDTVLELADSLDEVSECPKVVHAAAGKDFSLIVDESG